MGDKINIPCLSIDDDRVFEGFEDGILLTASREFHRRYNKCSIACRLPGELKRTPGLGQRLRMTLWHDSVVVKVDVREAKAWQTIFEMTELPEGMSCLAGCGEK